MTEGEGCIFVEYTVVVMVHDIYYGDVTLGCRAGYVTMQQPITMLSTSLLTQTWFTPALADLR